MSSTTKIVAKPIELKKVEPHPEKATSQPRNDLDVAALRQELQEKRKLLNLLEEKGVALPQIDREAIDRALADLDGIITASETAEA